MARNAVASTLDCLSLLFAYFIVCLHTASFLSCLHISLCAYILHLSSLVCIFHCVLTYCIFPLLFAYFIVCLHTASFVSEMSHFAMITYQTSACPTFYCGPVAVWTPDPSDWVRTGDHYTWCMWSAAYSLCMQTDIKYLYSVLLWSCRAPSILFTLHADWY